ncbi:MAG: RHS repeat protein [Verrucomicrobia bacterium]|nr:RHS repeat protein [Verrucomicrobiota bacterium]
MKPISFRLLSAVASLALSLPLAADDSGLAPSLEFSTGIVGTQTQLSWTAQPGVSYRISSTTDLSSGSWRNRAVVEATGTAGTWLDPEAAGPQAFYRIDIPQAAVFEVDPPVLSPAGGTILLRGQCLPVGGALVFEVEGGPPVSIPIAPGAQGQYSATVGVGEFVPGAHILSARVVDAGGTTVAAITQHFEVTETGRATDSPPGLPPLMRAMKASDGKKHFEATAAGRKKVFTNQFDVDLCEDITFVAPPSDSPVVDPASLLMPALMKAKEKATRTKCGHNLRQLGLAARGKRSEVRMNLRAISISGERPGEIATEQDDIVLETPVGPPIVWTRTYRSRAGSGGTVTSNPMAIYCGSTHFVSFDVRIEPIPLAAGSSATRIYLFGGDGRRDILRRQADGSYRCDGMFREGRFNPDNTFTLTFADKSQFVFRPPSGGPGSGCLSSVADSNGVALSLAYDGAGRLTTVSSQFGQSLTCAYDGNGRVSTLTDHTGRYVVYDYYATGEPGGGAGDLKSVSCVRAPGQQPLANPTVFTYSTGNADDNLNHNLLTVTDGAGRLVQKFTYSSQTDPLALDYDVAETVDSNRLDALSGHVTVLKIATLPPGSGAAYRCFENDELGRVTECDYDSQHRCVALRDLTGFALPDQPVTESDNRPAGKLRASDPEAFVTAFRYNADNSLTRVTHPDGTQELFTYGSELRRDCPIRERGNVHVISLRSPGGELRTVTCDYLPGFGTDECPSLAKEKKRPGRESPTKASLGRIAAGSDDDNDCGGPDPLAAAMAGHRIFVKNKAGSVPRAVASGVPEASDADEGATVSQIVGGLSIKGGDLIICGNPIGGIGIKSGKNPGGNLRTVGGLGIWGGEDGEGGCTDSARVVGPDGKDCTDPRRPRLGHCTRLTTSHGQVFTWVYDANGNCTSVRTPIDGAGCDASFNALGQCTGITLLNGATGGFTEQFSYDAASGWQLGQIHDPGELGLTTTCIRDTLGRVTTCTDPRGLTWLAEYDALDRLTVIRTPEIGTGAPSRIAFSCHYDSGGLLVRCDLEHRDTTGALDSANPAYSAFAVHDARGRLVRIAAEQRPVSPPVTLLDPATLGDENLAVRDFSYDDAGQCVRVSTPAASRGQATDEVCDFDYDERGLLYRTHQGGRSTTITVTDQCDYDALGACVACSRLPAAGAPGAYTPLTTTCAYDGFHRLSSVTDPMGNQTVYEYDEQGFATVSFMGEVSDEPGSASNVLLARVKSNLPKHTPKIVKESHGLAMPPSVFFDVFTADDITITERFSPGAQGTSPTETRIIHRSPAGLAMSLTNNADVILTCTYDSAGRLVTCTDGACSVSLSRDAEGRILVCGRTDHFRTVGQTDKTFTRTMSYDELGRCSGTQDGGSNSQTCAYDSLGRITEFAVARGTVHRNRYDGSVSSTLGTQPFSVASEVDVDGDGNFETLCRYQCWNGECRSITDAYGYVTTFTRDALGRLTQTDFPDGTHETRGFDPFGRPHSTVHRDGTVVTTELDRDGLPDLVTCSPPVGSSAPPVVTSYDHDGLGRTVASAEGTTILSRTWDSTGNPLSETTTTGSAAPFTVRTITRTFDHRGRTSVTYPDGTTFVETRDALGFMESKSAVSGTGELVSPPITVVQHAGYRPWRETRANGVVTTFEYRADGEPQLPLGGSADDFSFDRCVREQITSGTGALLSSTLYRRNRDQAPIARATVFGSANQAAGRRCDLTLDRLDRFTNCVTRVRQTTGGQVAIESDVSYTYDHRGRLLESSGSPYAGSYTQSDTLPPGDRQMGRYSTWPGGPLTWDPEGCLTSMSGSAGTKEFVYDAASRLIAVVGTGTVGTLATYAYDPAGRRISSAIPSANAQQPPAVTTFVYDGEDCVQELGADGLPDLTMATAEAAGPHLCIVSRNGTLVYPHGGGSANGDPLARKKKGKDDEKKDEKFVYRFLPFVVVRFPEPEPETELPEPCFEIPKKMTAPRPGPGILTSPAGAVVERTDCDDGGTPIFLTPDGIVRPSATGTLSGYDWSGSSRYCPETGFLVATGSVYSPHLGEVVSAHKEKSKETSKKEYTGHISLMK